LRKKNPPAFNHWSLFSEVTYPKLPILDQFSKLPPDFDDTSENWDGMTWVGPNTLRGKKREKVGERNYKRKAWLENHGLRL